MRQQDRRICRQETERVTVEAEAGKPQKPLMRDSTTNEGDAICDKEMEEQGTMAVFDIFGQPAPSGQYIIQLPLKESKLEGTFMSLAGEAL
jgi:hypothetical protein